MRATEFIVETAMMGKIADSGKIIRILKKAHTVPFSDEKNWLLVDTDPGKGNNGLGIKWIPADTRFEWVRPFHDNINESNVFTDARMNAIKAGKKVFKVHGKTYNVTGDITDELEASVNENLSPQTIHKLADRKGVKWDNEPSFLKLTKQLTGKEHLDDLDQAGLNKVKRHLDGLQGVAEEINSDVFNPAFNDTQIFDELTYRATAEKGYNDKTYFQVKVLDSNFQQVGLAKFSPTKRGLVSAMTWVHPEYQGQGLARNIYAYVRSLGNTIAPSRNQLPAGKAMWASWKKSGDAKYLMNDVAESDLDKYKKYIRPVVKTTPKIEKDNNPSGRTNDHIEWKVTSPTGEIHRYSSKKQAQDHFDSFGPKGVAENFADGRNPEDKGDSKRHGINTKASVSSLRKTAKSGGRKGQLAHWLANMKSGRAKKK